MKKTILSTQDNAVGKKKSSKGIDSVLEIMKGPQTVSTVAKSSMDWDNHKDETGLVEDLQNAGKNGYLEKKDFLDRCDVRTYVKEKEEQKTGKK